MKILIIEDELKAALRLEKLIKKNINDAKIIAILNSIEESIKWLENNKHPDLIFLDIQLSDGLSFAIFEQIEINIPVIFTTAYNEYSLKAFELNSVDYLLKPINEKKLVKSIKKYEKLKSGFVNNEYFNSKQLLDILKSKNEWRTKFLVNKGDSLIVIDIKDIAYFYAKDKYVSIVTFDNKKHLINSSLEKLEKEIETGIMYRANRQVLLSSKAIAKIHNYFNYKLKLELIPKADFDVIISRKKVADFKTWITRA